MSETIYQLDTRRVIERVLEAWDEELPKECLDQVAWAIKDRVEDHLRSELPKLFTVQL